MRRLLVITAFAICLAGCNGGKAPDAVSKPEEAPKSADSAKPIELSLDAQRNGGIETQPAGTQMMQETIKVTGTVSSTGKGRALVTPPVGGRIVAIQAQLGERVRQGQTLAVIESSELATAWASIAEARRSRDVAASELEQARSESELEASKLSAASVSLKRQSALAKAGAFSQAPLQQAQSELNDSQSGLLSSQKDASFKGEQLRRMENLFKDGLVSKVDLETARLELQQADIAVDKATAKVEIAKSTFVREKSISSQGLLNAREIQAASAEVRSAELEMKRGGIRIRSAQAALASAEHAVSNAQTTYRTFSGGGASSAGRANLVAPIAGTLTTVNVTRGQAVDRTQPVMEIEDLSAVWVTASVAEKDISKLRVGDSCTVTTPSRPGREFRGTVQVMGSDLDAKTRTLPIQCLMSGVNGALNPQMFATVLLRFGPSSSAVIVPKTAVVNDGAEAFVFIKSGQKFEKRGVKTGRSDGANLEIRSGLKAGEQVAAKGAFVLTSESKKDELKGEG